MKKIILFLSVVFTLNLSSSAQNNIQFKINHKLGDADFALETEAKNNIDHDFEVTRLEYYISEIIITHDGGTETTIENLWILVDANEETQVDLGDHNITQVEKLTFGIGVDEAHNHLDPASYPSTHPLAPQFPSMHWGWTAGYRFVAFEGNGGSNFDQVIQLHGLGDANYGQVEKIVNILAVDGEITFDLNADYTRALEDISVNSGVIVHGEDDKAAQVLRNFQDYVFSIDGEITSAIDISEVSKFEIFPNPASGQAILTLETSQDLTYQVAIFDIFGKQIMFFDEVRSNSTLDLGWRGAGFYFISLIKEGHPVITRKLIAK